MIVTRAVVYLNAFLTGFVVMGFEMLVSRYLNPYFGGSITTWAAIISSVLAALTLGYFVGGTLADRVPSPRLLGGLIMVSSLYISLIPRAYEATFAGIFALTESTRIGSLYASVALVFFPLTLLGMYSPFAIRLTLESVDQSGRVAGRIYAVSTLGSILGTLGVSFLLIPAMGSRKITFLLSLVLLFSALLLFLCPVAHPRPGSATPARRGHRAS